MLEITEKYYLGSNKTTFILYEKKVSETTGKENYKKIGYFASLDRLYTSLLEKEIRDDIQIITNIKKISDMIHELKEFTTNYYTNKQDEALQK